MSDYNDGYTTGFAAGYAHGFDDGFRVEPEKRKKIMMKVKLDKQKEAKMKFDEVLSLIMDLKKQIEEAEDDED